MFISDKDRADSEKFQKAVEALNLVPRKHNPNLPEDHPQPTYYSDDQINQINDVFDKLLEDKEISEYCHRKNGSSYSSYEFGKLDTNDGVSVVFMQDSKKRQYDSLAVKYKMRQKGSKLVP